MKTRLLSVGAGTLAMGAALAAVSVPAGAQSLSARIHATSVPRVQFEFAGRAGVCGDGQSFMSTGNGSSYYGRVNVVDGVATQACTAGPVRVVLDRSDDVITNIETVAGPLHVADGATDLGTVTGRDAVDYLMALATTTDGRASRQAILPAAIADGVDITPTLVTIAHDRNRPLDTRRSALSWLGRDDGTGSSARIAQATDLMLRLAQDENEAQPLRRSALSMLGRVGHGAGVPSLIRLANDDPTGWTGEASLRALAESDDPRAREFLRKEVRRADLPDALLAVAVRGLGGNQATGQDIDALRNAFAAFPGDRARATVMDVIAQRGTAADTQWLLGIARDTKQLIETRRRALDLAARSTAGASQSIALYDAMDDPALKESLIRIYAQSNDRAAVDKLISIAKTDSNYTLRRRAIASLSRTQDARAKEALQEITVR